MNEVVPGYFEFNSEILSYWKAAAYQFVEEQSLADPERFGMETVFALTPIAEVLSGIHNHYTINSDELLSAATVEIDLVMYVVAADYIPRSEG